MLQQLAIAVSGFSIITAILLLFQDRTESKIAKIQGSMLLGVLAVIQCLQLLITTDYLTLLPPSRFFYLFCLGLVGPLFYLYCQHLIETNRPWSVYQGRHFVLALILALIGAVFPAYFYIVYSLVFLIGGAYMAKLAWLLYQRRAQRRLFRVEFTFITAFLSWAIIVVLVALLSVQLKELLMLVQMILLGLAIAAALHIQLNYPHLLSSIEDIAQRQYQKSTLLNVDSEQIKMRLDQLMSIEKVYQDTELSLSALAEKLSLKPHQLSELLNTQLAMSFSTYLRQQRVKAAEHLLIAEPDASVLAISLSVGFSSQSAFYSAFKETHALAPGQYRRKILAE